MTFKKWVVAFVLAISFAANVNSAQAFPLPTYISFGPYVAQVAVTNPYGVPVACTGTVQGLRNDGFFQFANFAISFIPYGQTGYGYVYTGVPFFFVNASGWVDCGYLY